LRSPRTALRIVSGMLVLHFVTDALVFLTPMFFGFGDPFYLGLTTNTHASLWSEAIHYIAQTNLTGLFSQGVVFSTYFFSVLGLLFLFSGPVLLWFGLYSRKFFRIPSWLAGLSVASIIVFVFSQTLRVSLLTKEGIYGLDFSVQQTSLSLASLQTIFLLALACGLLVFFLDSWSRTYSLSKRSQKNSQNSFLREVHLSLQHVFIVGIQLTLILYAMAFLYTIVTYFIQLISYLWSQMAIVLLLLFVLLFVINIVFYLLGSVVFVEDTHKHNRVLELE
jgi:hypothetical protein